MGLENILSLFFSVSDPLNGGLENIFSLFFLVQNFQVLVTLFLDDTQLNVFLDKVSASLVVVHLKVFLRQVQASAFRFTPNSKYF